MGYCTDLYGKFDLNKNLTDPEVIYLTAFNETRHFKRDVTKMGFPKDYFMPCFIGVGKPHKGLVPVKQKEINIKERIHWDTF